MKTQRNKRIVIVLIHAFIGWLFCAAIMGIGMKLVPISTLLIIHAIAGPAGFVLLSYVYFCRYNYTTPLQTAFIFVLFIIVMDFVVVALAIEQNLDMFRSLLGTWIPFALIFLSTYITGRVVLKISEYQKK